MNGEFLLEVGTEEIPASYIMPAATSLAERFAEALGSAHIDHGRIEAYATPRRLILRAAEVTPVQASREIQKTGPQKAAAFDEEGNPTKAAEGFARSQGVAVADLVIVTTSKGEQVAVRKIEEGLPTSQILSQLIPGLLEKIPFPKSMRWMDLDVRFARPVHWIVALLDGTVIPVTFGSVSSGDSSRGHRFTNPQEFRVSSLADLQGSLEAQGVLIDPEQRREKIEREIDQLAAAEGLKVFADQELLEEVTFLVESPYPLMGEFPAEFLELPASVLITCMKKHQRYFSIEGSEGGITNKFIAINNTPVKDPAVSVA